MKEKDNISDLSKRVLQILESKGYTAYRLEKEVKEITSSKITHIKSGRNQPSDEIINALLNKFPDVSRVWLLTGEESMLKSDSNIISEPKIEYNKKPEVEYTPNMYIVPLRAWGGFLAGYERRVFDLEKIPFPLVKGECFAFEIGGFSMLKEYKPGDYFIGSLIEGFDWLIKGRDYVFQTINGLILKRFVKIEDDLCYMESINEEYNPVDPMPLKEIKALYQREGVYNK